MHVSTN